MADQKRITLYSGQVPQGSNIVDWTSGDRVTDIAANNNAQAFYFDQNKTQPVPAGFLKQNNFGIQLSPEDVYAGAIAPINLVMNKTLQEYTKNRLNGYYDENGNVNIPNSNVSVYIYEQALKNPYLYDWFNTYMPDTKGQYLKYIGSHPNLSSRTPYDILYNIPMTGNIQSPHFINGYAQMGLEADTGKDKLINDAFMVTLPSNVILPEIRLTKDGLNRVADAVSSSYSDDHTTDTRVEILNNDEKAFGGKLLNNNNLFNNGGNSTIEYHPFNTQNKEHQEVGLQGLMKSTLANQATLFNNPTAKRILGYDNRQYVFKPNEISEDGGEVGNVYLSSYDEYVSPGIQEDENHNLHYVPSKNMWDDAHENNTLKQSFKFRNPEEAEYFAEHYKEVSPYSMTNNDEYSPIKKLFDNDEDNYSKGGSIREKAKEIRLKVAEKFKPIYDYLYNEDTEDNQYKRGGKVRRNTGESAFDRDVNTTLALDKYKKYNTPEWRAFLKSIAYQESSFRPNAKSIAGAIGFYQLMPYENLSHLTEAQKKSGNWNQTALMLDHIEQVQKDIHNRLNYATLQKAKMMGLNDYDLLAIAHFSGVGGLRKWLRHSSPNNFKEGAKDGYGMSQFGYLKKFRKGMAKYSNNPEKETITPFPTESPTFDYKKYTEAILNQGLARLNAQYSQNYQDLPTYGPTKQNENPFEIKQLQDNFSSPFPLPNQLTQQPIQSAFGGIINRDNPIQNYSNNPNIGLPTVRY